MNDERVCTLFMHFHLYNHTTFSVFGICRILFNVENYFEKKNMRERKFLKMISLMFEYYIGLPELEAPRIDSKITVLLFIYLFIHNIHSCFAVESKMIHGDKFIDCSMYISRNHHHRNTT